MKKILATAVLAIIFLAAAHAQNATGTGVQNANLEMENAIQIAFTAENANVTVPFSTLNEMINGVETATHQVVVSSNRAYKVTVKQTSDEMSYAGQSLVGSLLRVSNVVKVMVTENNTGGYQPLLAQIFGWQSFSILGTPVTLLSGCRAGGNKTFSVKYKVTPGLNFTSGTYATDMVYTATQQ